MTTPKQERAAGWRSQRASWWSITINNPTDEDYESIKSENWPSFVKRFKRQEEVGENETPHIQGALNTAQVRAGAVADWLPRAHVEVAKNVSGLVKYVGKSETAVEGTLVDERKEYLTMDKALRKLATYWEPMEERRREFHKEDMTKINTEEYWTAVNVLLQEDSTLVQLYTNPQMLRAWVHTKNVWLKYKKDAESPSCSVSEKPEDSQDEVRQEGSRRPEVF